MAIPRRSDCPRQCRGHRFRGLSPLDPPVKRLDNQAAEDAFCQRLLLLGAKWWDSEARYLAVVQLKVYVGRADDAPRMDVEPQPTMREKRFVKVGWPSTGGLWVAEFDTTFAGVDEEGNLLPEDEGAARLRMAWTMDERCVILRDRFKATFYEYLKDYKGYAFLNSWDMKETGEVGPLLQSDETMNIWYKSHLDRLKVNCAKFSPFRRVLLLTPSRYILRGKIGGAP